MIQITSRDNPNFRLWKSLLSSKGIKREGLFLLSGEKLVREVAFERRFEIVTELVGPSDEPLTQARHACRLPAELFRELDELGTHHPLLVLKTPEIRPWEPGLTVHSEGLELFCPLGDPQNLGAVLRSAEAFGVDKVVLLEEAANPFLPKAIKASAGSSLRVKLERGPRLSELTGSFYALDLEGAPLPQFRWPAAARLLIGEEGTGLKHLSPQARIQALSIPTAGVESLNAGVAAGIALFHYRGQHLHSGE